MFMLVQVLAGKGGTSTGVGAEVLQSKATVS